MANPLLLMLSDPRARRARRFLPVAVPREIPSTDAIFLMLRRLRVPLIVLIGIFSVSVVGLTLIPGPDGTRLGVFESFYFITYTATTIGFGEITDFTTPQRMWVTFSIYLTVIGWAYAIGTCINLVQDETVREAFTTHRFGRRVRRLQEDFVIVAGYGKAGRQVVLELDAHGHRVVVVDRADSAIDRLATESLYADVPGLSADGSLPGVLGLAGLGKSRCQAVLALTDDDDTNLAIVIAVSLLRPDVPVIARAHTRSTAAHMRELEAGAVVHPSDRFGEYLLLAMERPDTYRLVATLMSEQGVTTPDRAPMVTDGRWIIVGDDAFVTEVADDLRRTGLEVDVVEASSEHLDVGDAVGLIAGADSDTVNLALAERARRDDADLFVAVRQASHAHRALVEALQIDAVYSPTDLVANEALVRVVTPVTWSFVEHALAQDDVWSTRLLARIGEHCGEEPPERRLVRLDRRGAPAIDRWLQHSRLTVGDLARQPDDRDAPLRLTTLLIVRDGHTIYAPEDEVELRRHDQLLLAGTHRALDELVQVLDYDSVVEYVATGRRVPDGWVWRRLTGVQGASDVYARRRRHHVRRARHP
ncbi:NAD-binding protein [Mobilicoccus sp.]|uniref:NAD-binding protein n=1 Tax=Mobilicoccus sp. TaxID=2034349 RepID=UPI0028969FD9|nr:NAD-binding protein [Mobilicoccus sp.]